MNSALRVVRHLEGHGVACAFIGGVALGAHGIARSTLDVDVLVADPRVLEADFWIGLDDLGKAESRRGDAEDPLVGIVRFPQSPEPVDVVVGRSPWTRRILERRTEVQLVDQAVPVVDRADLVLLKLYAGGPQDLLDARLLLAAEEIEMPRIVEGRLGEAPAAVRSAWRRLRG